MRFLLWLCLLCVSLHSEEDQFSILFGSSGYVLYKALDFAVDHGFRYVQILHYEFSAFDHIVSGKAMHAATGGREFTLEDEHSSIRFACFKKQPTAVHIIDVEKYRPLLDEIATKNE